MLTQARLKELFNYNPETGIFTRLISTSNSVKPGDVITCTNKKGYVVFRVDGRLYRAHRLAWLYMTGNMPIDEIDHKNTIKTDNSFLNLREATRLENKRNINITSKNTSGFKGVSFCKNKTYFRAYATVNKKQINLGCYKTAESAYEARLAFVNSNFKEFSRG